jgi:hypothetical protein
MIQKISIVVLALFMSAASAYAIAPVQTHHVPPIKRHHMTHGGMMIPICAEGQQTKAKCVCGSKTGAPGLARVSGVTLSWVPARCNRAIVEAVHVGAPRPRPSLLVTDRRGACSKSTAPSAPGGESWR